MNRFDWGERSKIKLEKLFFEVLGCVWLNENAFPSVKSFQGKLFSHKGKYIWLFGCLGIHFTENQFRCLVRSNLLWKMLSVLRKINSHVWFGQTFYEKWNSFFTENQFSCLVCRSFYGKYEMPYKFKHLHYLDKPITIQN